MKNILCVTAVMLGIGLASCSKDSTIQYTSSSFTVVNAIIGSNTIFPNFQAGAPLIKDSLAQTVLPDAYTLFKGYVGTYHLSFSQLSDTTHTVYNGTVAINPGSISTLYLCGTVASPDSLFAIDQVPVLTNNLADSLTGIRFVNLSTGFNKGVNINLQGNPGTVIVGGLGYKGISDFVKMAAASKSPSSYTFEFRDAETNAVVATSAAVAAYPTQLFKSVTVVLYGVQGGTGINTPATMVVNNY